MGELFLWQRSPLFSWTAAVGDVFGRTELVGLHDFCESISLSLSIRTQLLLMLFSLSLVGIDVYLCSYLAISVDYAGFVWLLLIDNIGLYIYVYHSASLNAEFGHVRSLANVCLQFVFGCIDGCMSDYISLFLSFSYCYISWFGFLWNSICFGILILLSSIVYGLFLKRPLLNSTISLRFWVFKFANILLIFLIAGAVCEHQLAFVPKHVYAFEVRICELSFIVFL